MFIKISNKEDLKYYQYNDFNYKNSLKEGANGVLGFVGIPYRINREIVSETTNFGPKICRMDFVGEAETGKDTIALIIECQTEPPTEDDIKRFFQYVSSIRVLTNKNVEIYILCTEKVDYDKKEFVLNDDCILTMHVISLKDKKAREMFKCIENKLKNNEVITEEDIAALQLIVYTDYNESKYDILKEAKSLIKKIANSSVCEVTDEKGDVILDVNKQSSIFYLFNVLSVNMLNNNEQEKFMEETGMLLCKHDEYILKKGREESREEIAINLLKDGNSVEYVSKMTGLNEKTILSLK